MSKTRSENMGETIPHVSEFEAQVLSILKKDVENKEKVKEILEKYATRYSAEAGSGT